MSKRKDWKGRNCVRCNQEGRAKIKLAQMACEHRTTFNGKPCGAFVCHDHGHTEGKGQYCNTCRPWLFNLAQLAQDLTPIEA